MKKVLKQTMSVFLAVVMMFTITLPAFAEENLAPETQTEQNLSYNSSNALGETLVNAIEDEDASRDEYDGKGIFNVSITGLEATVSMSAPDDCTVVVALYEEETMQMVTSGKTPVSSEDTAVTVTLAEYELPDFFVIKAFILNSDNAPVCPEYVNLENTKLFVESLSKTTADFDSELVINLDESETDNFAVVSENAQTAQANKETNILVSADEDNGVFVIENADESITSLKKGDVLYFTYGDDADDYILTKIGSIKTKDGITTITASDDYEMSELFEYIHVDTSKMQQENSKARGFDDDEGSVDEDGKSFAIESDGFMEFPENDEDADWSLKLYFTGFVGFCVKFHYDFKILGKDYYNFEYWVSVNAAAAATFDFETEIEKTIDLVDSDFQIIPGLEIHFALRLTVKVVASLHVQGQITFSMRNGARRSSDSGQEKIQQEPTFTFEADVEGDFSIDLIPEIETGFRVLKVFFVDLTVPFTFNVSGTLYVPTSAEEIEKHPCITCIDGTVTANIKLGITVKFGLKRDNAIIIIEITPVNKKVSLGMYEKFYLSVSENGFEPGLGTCPYIVQESDDETGSDDDIFEDDIFGDVIEYGTCGDNLKWGVTLDGKLVISGTGAMTDYIDGDDENVPPWLDLVEELAELGMPVTSVIICEGVTTIGQAAFGGNTFKTISIPTSVTKVGTFAFANTALETVYYNGTDEQLSKVKVSVLGGAGPISISNSVGKMMVGMGSPFNEAIIVCTGTDVNAAAMSLSRAAIPMTISNGNSESIYDAIVGNNYIMLVVKDVDAQDLLAPENLLYIDQKTAESETLSFDFVVDESETQYSVLFFGEKLPHYHLYDGVITVEPTCTENGVKTFTCECEESYTETIDAIGHSHIGEVTAPTCTAQGFTTYTCTCGDTYVSDYVDATGHSYESEITTPATHLTEGVMTFTCECGDTYTEPVAKLTGHTYDAVVTAPTCTEKGYTTYTCECGDSYADNYVDSTGHTDEIIPGYAATCTQTGLTDGVKCSVCGTVTTVQKTIPVVSHKDSNNDGLCDDCGFDFTKDCSHTCHSTSGFIKFFWKIISFLQKLFGVKSAQYCDCGVAHW